MKNFLVPVIVSVICVVCGYILGSRDSELIVKYEDNGVLVDAGICGLSAEDLALLESPPLPEFFPIMDCLSVQNGLKMFYQQRAYACSVEMDGFAAVITLPPDILNVSYAAPDGE